MVSIQLKMDGVVFIIIMHIVIENLLANTKARSTYYENVAGTINILTALQNCEI